VSTAAIRRCSWRKKPFILPPRSTTWISRRQEALRSIFGILKDKGIRLVVAQVMEDVKDESSYQLGQLFGEDAFYDTIENVLEAYRQQVSAGPAPDASDLGEGTVHTR